MIWASDQVAFSSTPQTPPLDIVEGGELEETILVFFREKKVELVFQLISSKKKTAVIFCVQKSKVFYMYAIMPKYSATKNEFYNFNQQKFCRADTIFISYSERTY